MAVLFAAMLLYLGYALISSFHDSFQTSPAVMTTLEETAEASGIAIRQELVVVSDRAYVFVSAADGSAVAKGGSLGSAMDSQTALERAGRVRELTNEIKHVETVLSGLTEAADLTERDAAIRAGVLSMRESLSANDLSELDAACASISSLIFPELSATVSESDLAALRAELAAIEKTPHTDSEDLAAPESGLFTTLLDGYEALTPEALNDLTVSSLKELMSVSAKTEAGAVGKVITSARWYYAGLIPSADGEMLEKGDYVTVTFPRHGARDVSMRVERVSDADGGQCAVVLSSLRSLMDTAAMREAEAVISVSRQSGLRVPAKALHVDEDGDAYVYVITARRLEIKYVDIITDAGDYFLVEEGVEADSLREGNEMIVGGRNIYEGMILE